MPMWTSVVAMFRSFKNTQEKEYPSNTLTKTSRLLWLPIFITRAARRPAVLIDGRDDNDCFLYMLLQWFAIHKPRLQAPSDYISDVIEDWTHRHSIAVVVN